MQIINKIKENINVQLVDSLPNELKEIALCKIIYIEACKYFYRDEIFFLFKENLKLREKIYNKNIKYPDIIEGNITCNSLCYILKELFQEYDINTQKIIFDYTTYSHTMLIINTNNKHYLIDPLVDLIRVKEKDKLECFGTIKEKNNYHYDTLSDNENNIINKAIGYNENFFKDKCFLIKNEIKNNNQNKIEIIFQNMQYIYTSGIVDLKMIIKDTLNQVLGNYDEIEILDYFVDNNDIVDDVLYKYTHNYPRHRGILIKSKDYVYLVNTTFKYIRFDINYFEKFIEKNNLKINSFINISSLKYFQENNVSSEIIHNRWFLNMISIFEKQAKENNDNLQNYIVYIDNGIMIKYHCDITITIIDNQIHLIDNNRKNDYIINYLENKVLVKKYN